MNCPKSHRSNFVPGGWTVLLLSVWCSVSHAADWLQWDKSSNQVAAHAEGKPLMEILEAVSEATGWEVFLEPGTDRTITTKFEERPPGKALDLLLADLSRALLPGTNGGFRLLVFRTDQSKAVQKVAVKKGEGTETDAKPIPNELIVRVKPGTDIEALARKLGARVVGRIDGLNTYRLRFDDEAATNEARRLLGEDPEVLSVESNYPVYRDLPMQPMPGAMPLNLQVKAVPDGDRIIVGLIDTQVDADKSGIKDFLLPELSVVGDTEHPSSQPLHGDSMAQAILQGVAMTLQDAGGSAVRILPVVIYEGSTATTSFHMAAGVYEAINAGAMIINISSSSLAYSPLLHEVIRSGYEQNVRFYAAAGNEPTAALNFPAAHEEVIAVTASDANGNIAPFANHGDFVDIGAPGVSQVYFDGQSWRVGGTSVSTAYASGTAAALRQMTGADWAKIGQLVQDQLAVQPKP